MKKAALVLFFALACGCTERNAVQTSPSGSYEAYLSISQCPNGYGIWVVNISTGEDQVELLEFMNDYPANLMAYMAWDHNDRLWFYSSDDGRYFYWERVGDGEWNRYSWSILESSSFAPPESLDDRRERI
jgi:hypothetical protein